MSATDVGRQPVFLSGVEWAAAAVVLAMPWLSIQFMISLDDMRDPPLEIFLIMATGTAVTVGVLYLVYYVLRRAIARRDRRPSGRKVFREMIWGLALGQALIAYVTRVQATGADTYFRSQAVKMDALARVSLLAMILLLCIGIAGFLRERQVYGRLRHTP